LSSLATDADVQATILCGDCRGDDMRSALRLVDDWAARVLIDGYS